MAPQKSIWYYLGHAYERARLGSGGEGTVGPRAERPERGEGAKQIAWPEADELFSAATWLVLDRVVGVGDRGRRPGISGLVKAGAAGAAAALLIDLIRPLLLGDPKLAILDAKTPDRLLAGVGQGLVYGALVEPRVPGSALLKGALYGSVEYATDQMGGLSALLGSHAPQGRLPGVGALLEGLDPHDRAFLEHLVFGIALALLYESSPSSNGTRADLEEGEE